MVDPSPSEPVHPDSGGGVRLVRADGSEKPSYALLDGVVDEEWHARPMHLRTDADGRIAVTGPRGTRRATAGGRTTTFTVPGPAAGGA